MPELIGPIPTGDPPFTSKSSGLLTNSQSIKSSSGILIDLLLYTDGINAASVTIYDNPAAASGKVIAKLKAAGADLMVGEVNINTDANTGIYVDISGAGAEVLLRYR